jgi:hypothetical protein
MALRGDELFLSYGVMGGFMQPQGHVQVLLNMLRGFSVQAALDAPRFCISAGSPETQSADTGTAGDINSEVYFEHGIAEEVVKKLRGAFIGLAGGEPVVCVQSLISIVYLILQRWATTRVLRLGLVAHCSVEVRLSNA